MSQSVLHDITTQNSQESTMGEATKSGHKGPRALWLLPHPQYKTLAKTSLGYLAVDLGHGDPAALDLQN